MQKFIGMYVTMIPLVCAGISNMIFTKTRIYNKYKYPIDCYKILDDGNRLLGNNKTIIGFISMIIFVTLYQILWGSICNQFNFNKLNDWYLCNTNNIQYNLEIGFITGLIYVVSELPNSFIKRRIGIQPGKTSTGIKGITFLIIDQTDSLIGIFILLSVVSHLSIVRFIAYIVVGTLMHIILNYILYKLKIRRNL